MATEYDVYAERLETAQLSFDEDVMILAYDIREEIILPFCRKYRLTFLAGRGEYFFVRKVGGRKECFSDVSDLDRHKPKHRILRDALIPIFELLAKEVVPNDPIGYYVASVHLKDLK